MRIAALVNGAAWRALTHAMGPGQDVTRLNAPSDAVLEVRHARCDVLVVDPGVLRSEEFAQLHGVFTQRTVPVLLLGELTQASARQVVRITELGTHELVLIGEGDTARLIAQRLAAIRDHSVPAHVLSHAARRMRTFPDRLQAASVGLFGSGALPRWVNDLARSSGLARRSLDRWISRAGFHGASRLLEVARLARVWEPLVDEKLPIAVVSETCGYEYPRLFVTHARRLLGVPPARIGDAFGRREYSEALSKLLVASKRAQ